MVSSLTSSTKEPASPDMNRCGDLHLRQALRAGGAAGSHAMHAVYGVRAC